MVKEYPPPTLHALAAVGPIGDEHNHQQNYSRDPQGRRLRAEHYRIGRRPNPVKHNVQIVTDCRLAAIDLRIAWLAMTATQRDSWKPFAKRWRLHLYFAYTKFNLTRVVHGLPIVQEP